MSVPKKMKFRRQSARFKTGFWQLACLALAVGLPLGAVLAAGEPPPPSAWRVVMVGSTHPQETQIQPIPGAKDTQCAAALATSVEGGRAMRLLSKEEFTALGVDWATFSSQAAAAASAKLASLQPELIRDRNQVIDCAILRSTRPTDDITIAVLAPDFLKRFTPLFGRKMLLAIPDRHTVYLFPKLASRYQDYGERVLAVYRKSESPVSREVFELSTGGLRAIGEYTGP